MKIFNKVAISAITLLTITSCSTDNIDANHEIESTAPQSLSVAALSVDTKVSFKIAADKSVKMAWEVGDVISLYSKVDDAKSSDFEILSLTDGDALFTKVSGDDLVAQTEYIAIYPASTASKYSDVQESRDASKNPTALSFSSKYDNFFLNSMDADLACLMTDKSFTYGADEQVKFTNDKLMLDVVIAISAWGQGNPHLIQLEVTEGETTKYYSCKTLTDQLAASTYTMYIDEAKDAKLKFWVYTEKGVYCAEHNDTFTLGGDTNHYTVNLGETRLASTTNNNDGKLYLSTYPYDITTIANVAIPANNNVIPVWAADGQINNSGALNNLTESLANKSDIFLFLAGYYNPKIQFPALPGVTAIELPYTQKILGSKVFSEMVDLEKIYLNALASFSLDNVTATNVFGYNGKLTDIYLGNQSFVKGVFTQAAFGDVANGKVTLHLNHKNFSLTQGDCVEIKDDGVYLKRLYSSNALFNTVVEEFDVAIGPFKAILGDL